MNNCQKYLNLVKIGKKISDTLYIRIPKRILLLPVTLNLHKSAVFGNETA